MYETGLLFDILHITSQDWLINWHKQMTSSTNQDDAILSQQVEDLSINNYTDMATTCANCGNEGTNLNICNKCKAATYCNAACKKKHRSKHKQDCEKRAAELAVELHKGKLEQERQAAELRDRELFKEPPPIKDCDICMLPLPQLESGKRYKPCCGNIICAGCIYAVAIRDKNETKCPFCRTPTAVSNKEIVQRIKKRVEIGDAEAIDNMGSYYCYGQYGLPRSINKALELWHRAADLGHTDSYHNIGVAYDFGKGVKMNEKMANHYYELAAMGGNASSRYNIGSSEYRVGNIERALKHQMIAVGSGYSVSLSAIQRMYKDREATKDDYAKALRAYQAYLGEIKSVQRDEAAAAIENYKYYELLSPGAQPPNHIYGKDLPNF